MAEPLTNYQRGVNKLKMINAVGFPSLKQHADMKLAQKIEDEVPRPALSDRVRKQFRQFRKRGMISDSAMKKTLGR